MSVKGKLAVVTGASGGIGRATAERLRDEGMRVIGVDINPEGLRAVMGIEHLVADLSNDEGRAKVVEAGQGAHTLVNAAGLIFATGTEDNKAYIYDTDNGNELWNFEMEAAGSAPPILFSINEKQYVSFLSTGGQYYNFKKKGSTLYTFSVN